MYSNSMSAECVADARVFMKKHADKYPHILIGERAGRPFFFNRFKVGIVFGRKRIEVVKTPEHLVRLGWCAGYEAQMWDQYRETFFSRVLAEVELDDRDYDRPLLLGGYGVAGCTTTSEISEVIFGEHAERPHGLTPIGLFESEVREGDRSLLSGFCDEDFAPDYMSGDNEAKVSDEELRASFDTEAAKLRAQQRGRMGRYSWACPDALLAIREELDLVYRNSRLARSARKLNRSGRRTQEKYSITKKHLVECVDFSGETPTRRIVQGSDERVQVKRLVEEGPEMLKDEWLDACWNDIEARKEKKWKEYNVEKFQLTEAKRRIKKASIQDRKILTDTIVTCELNMHTILDEIHRCETQQNHCEQLMLEISRGGFEEQNVAYGGQVRELLDRHYDEFATRIGGLNDETGALEREFANRGFQVIETPESAYIRAHLGEDHDDDLGEW